MQSPKQRAASLAASTSSSITPGTVRERYGRTVGSALQIREITLSQWRRFVAIHTTAPLALTDALVPEIIRQVCGRIIKETTSLGGNPTYGHSKAALEALSAIMAEDLEGTRGYRQRASRRRGDRYADDLR